LLVQRRDAEIRHPARALLWDILIVTSYRLALALPLLFAIVSNAWAQAPQAPTAAPAPSDQQVAPDNPIGNVATLTGTATVTRNNAATPLKLKDDIYLNDVVATSATSSLGITFSDATTFTLKANAQVTIDNYVYEENGKNNSGIFDIAKGTVAFAAAAVAKTGNMQITTPTSALGIRGTTGLVEVPEGGAAATTASNIKLYPDADGRVGQIEVNDRQGRRLGALTQGASGFAIRGGPGGARFAAVPLTISPQQATRDQGFVRQLHATQTVGRQIVSQQREFRRANPQYRNPARPRQQPGQNRPAQPGTTPNRPGQPGTPNNRPGQPQQGAPNRQGQQTPGNPQQPAGVNRQGQQQPPGAPQQATPARPGQPGAAPSGTAQPNTLPRTPGAPPVPAQPGVGPRSGAAPAVPPGVGRPGGPRPRLPGLPKGKPPPEKKRR
jgi:hypothetical protein